MPVASNELVNIDEPRTWISSQVEERGAELRLNSRAAANHH